MPNQRTTTLPKGISWAETAQGMRLKVRVQIINPKTGKPADTSRIVPLDAGMSDGDYRLRALQYQISLRLDINGGGPGNEPIEKVHFGPYIEGQIQSKIDRGKIMSPATKQKYRDILDNHLLDKWGDRLINKITRKDVKDWLGELGKLAQAGKYAPHYLNDWWGLFKAAMREAAMDYGIGDPTSGFNGVPHAASDHRTYTRKEPNSLLIEELPAFFGAAQAVAPDHYGMLVLGLLTGRRPCELLPIRRAGDDPDLDWGTGVLEIRRSITVPDIDWQTKQRAPSAIPRGRTKTKKDLCAFLPPSMLDILRAHVGRLRGMQKDSELLFPPKWTRTTETAVGYQSRWGLRDPLKRICEAAKIKKHLTPRMMRRTYNDLCRAAEVREIVQMSMSGHATKEMVELYSTIAETEGKASLARMCAIAGVN